MAQFVGLRTAAYGVGTHVISLTPPAGAQAGDQLFIQAMGWSTVGPPADPVGWSRLNRANSVLSADYYSAVWQAPYGTAMSLTWTVPAGDNGLVVGLWAWRDAVLDDRQRVGRSVARRTTHPVSSLNRAGRFTGWRAVG